MAEAVGAVLAFAVGVGISPIPIIATIAVLFSARARVNGPVFLLGWMVGLAVVVSALYLLARALDLGSGSSADDAVSWVRIAAGVALGVLAVRRWRTRPRPGDEPEPPAWMARVDDLTPTRAVVLAVVLSANPKNLALALGAATALGQQQPSTGAAVVALATFVGIGSAGIAAAVASSLAGGDAARQRLEEARSWLAVHDSAVMAVLFLVFSALLISAGLGLRG